MAIDRLAAGTIAPRKMDKGLFFFLQCVATVLCKKQTSKYQQGVIWGPRKAEGRMESEVQGL